ncbi:MAG: hypothetical protein ACJ71P_16910 [Nitrososphaeraceae archaeon]
MEKRQNTGALQQRIQPKRDITDIASWTGYSKQRYIIPKKSSQNQHQKIH